jgi:tetratricopeptide (TPR) repeat protein
MEPVNHFNHIINWFNSNPIIAWICVIVIAVGTLEPFLGVVGKLFKFCKNKYLRVFPNKDNLIRSYLPNKPEYFIGRTDQLNELNNILKTNNVVVLVNGLGGIGKTTIVLEYIHKKEYYKKYQHIEWVSVTDDIQSSIIIHKFSDSVKFIYDINKQPNENFKILMAELNNIIGNNLLVIDNAKDEKDIINNLDELKRSNWKIVFASRCDVQEIQAKIEIGVLKHEEAKKLFIKHCPDIKDLAILETLLIDIHHHTLLIELLAKTLKSNKALSISTLFEKFQKDGIKAPDFQIKVNTGTHAVMTNKDKQARINEYIQSMFDISSLNEKGKKNLLYFSILPSIEIYFGDLKIFFNVSEENEIEFIESLNHIVANGWIQENNKTYKMHPLIQSVINEKLKPDAENCSDIIITFANILYYDSYQSPLSKKEFVPFAESIWNIVYDASNEQQMLTNNLASLINNLALIFSIFCNYEKALEYQKIDIKILEQTLGLEHPDLACSYNNIASTYCSLGNYFKALEYQKKSISILEKVLDPKYHDLATSYNNIAITYQNLGNYFKALDYQKISISILEKVLDPEHPDLASSYNNIALLYQNIVNYDLALEYQKKSITIREKVLDPEHPDLAISYGNIALTYGSLGNYRLALEYQKKSIAIFEKVMGPDHPSLATFYNNLATTYYNLNDFKNAKNYIDRAIEIYNIKLPKEHPNFLNSLEWRKIIYDALGTNL